MTAWLRQSIHRSFPGFLFPLYRRAYCSHSTRVKRLVVESDLNLRHVSKLFTSNLAVTLGPIYIVLGLPWWLRQYRICLLCRRPEFDPWVGKIPWRREWLPTPVFLPGESHGQGSRVGYSPWDGRVRHNCATNTFIFFHILYPGISFLICKRDTPTVLLSKDCRNN